MPAQGADDYVTKPFNRLEFLARIKAQLGFEGDDEDGERGTSKLSQSSRCPTCASRLTPGLETKSKTETTAHSVTGVSDEAEALPHLGLEITRWRRPLCATTPHRAESHKAVHVLHRRGA